VAKQVEDLGRPSDLDRKGVEVLATALLAASVGVPGVRVGLMRTRRTVGGQAVTVLMVTHDLEDGRTAITPVAEMLGEDDRAGIDSVKEPYIEALSAQVVVKKVVGPGGPDLDNGTHTQPVFHGKKGQA
jgi:hypothetical protein